jgi:hypothetical protein
MGVGTLICPVQQDLQERNVAWMGLSSRSPNFNKDATVKLDTEQFPMFIKLTINSPNFHEECTTFDNILIINYNVITL